MNLFLAFLWSCTLFVASRALVLENSHVRVVFDDVFPRPLNYTFKSTNETFRGALTGWGFHLELLLNDDQVVCGEANMETNYTSSITSSLSSVEFVTQAACSVRWSDSGMPSVPKFPPTYVIIQLMGSIRISQSTIRLSNDTTNVLWNLNEITVAPNTYVKQVNSLRVVGFELVSFRPKLPITNQCMYTVDDNGKAPQCGGDNYYVDDNQWTALDEWYSPTWSQNFIQGQVDINTLPNGNVQCIDGAASRKTSGPLSSLVAGGWTQSSKTGIAFVSSQNHIPFWTGLRSYDVPGRCSTFTVAPSTIFASFLCGRSLPYNVTIGLFSDISGDGNVNSDDVNIWRRLQYPVADPLYRTKIPFKLMMDATAYVPSQNRITFAQGKDYFANMSLIFDSYPMVPILVGWQGLGHDTLYPSLDVVNQNLGGQAELFSLHDFLMTTVPGSSLSYHVNTDEAYSHFNGKVNPEFDIGICRINVDHDTPWYSNCTVTHEQTPDCGIRCSISKTRDHATYGRYDRYNRMFQVTPNGLQTIHSDAWRDVGSSWEPTGFLSMESEQFCGQVADHQFWRSHGASMGCEGENGQAAIMMGVVSYYYHGNGWDVSLWGRIITGSSLGFDEDVFCDNTGGKCGWTTMADSFYMGSKLYQLALTDELFGFDSTSGHHIFRNGGKVHISHTYPARKTLSPDVTLSPPTTWPYGGDTIPIATLTSVFVPIILSNGSISPDTMYVYTASWGAAGNSSWTLPLSWVGHTFATSTITPKGIVPNEPAYVIQGRTITFVGLTPTWPVRFQRLK